MEILTIYVPKEGGVAASVVAPKSAIVGRPVENGRVLVHFEGAINGQQGMESFFLKLMHAAGRLVANYPTVATAILDATDLVPVGTYDARRWVVLSIDDEGPLRVWSGESAEEVRGKIVPTGGIAWNAAAALVQAPLGRGLGEEGGYYWAKTQAGQVIRFSLGGQEAEVFDYTSPMVPERFPK